MDDQEQGVFSFEEFEQTQVAGHKRARRRELLVGLALLLIVLGLAGWNWWLGQTQLAAYRAGDSAATAQDWDTAQARFTEAGDYADAKGRAATSAANIAERNKQYTLATTALAANDGVAALQALDAIDKLQPHYRDSATMRAQGEGTIYRNALEGMVAQRSEADPPGLYYRSHDAWIWLQGSDNKSTPRNYGDGNYIVYDVPAQTPAGKRTLVVAHMDGAKMTFAPSALATDQIIYLGAQGGWASGYSCNGQSADHLRGSYCSDGMIYSAAGSTITSTVKLPGQGWLVLDLALDGSKMLVADTSREQQVPPQVSLYLAAPDGSKMQLLDRDSGWIERAAFSQDGHYVMATFGASDAYASITRKAMLLDTTGRAQPLLISSEFDLGLDGLGGIDFVMLSGAASGKIAVVRYSAGQTSLQLLDLSAPAKTPLPIWSSQQFEQPIMVTRMADGGVLMCGQIAKVSITLDHLNTDSGECMMLNGAQQTTTFSLPKIARFAIGYAWPRSGSIIYPVAAPGGGGTAMSVLRIGPPDSGDANAAVVILQLSLEAGQRLNLVAGPRMLAYARQGILHARSYDGNFDLPLEQGVDILFDVRGATDTTMLF